MRVAVVGHAEWVTFVELERLPVGGEIVRARATWDDAGGGGAVPAVELARQGADVDLFCALGDDEHGTRTRERLEELGVRVHAAPRPRPHWRAFTMLEPGGERTIVVFGHTFVPSGDDPLPWGELAAARAAYVVSGDAGAVRAARAAGVLVVSGRAREGLRAAGVEVDVLVSSAADPDEAIDPAELRPAPRATVRTLGAEGGRWSTGGKRGEWAGLAPPGPVGDAYGAGDCFAAGLTLALAQGRPLPVAVEAGARAGADCLSRRGPYERSDRRTSGGA
jgi:ribokinase